MEELSDKLRDEALSNRYKRLQNAMIKYKEKHSEDFVRQKMASTIEEYLDFGEITLEFFKEKAANTAKRYVHFMEYWKDPDQTFKYDMTAVKRDLRTAYKGTHDVLKYLYNTTINPKFRALRKEKRKEVFEFAHNTLRYHKMFSRIASKLALLPPENAKAKRAAEYFAALTIWGLPERLIDLTCKEAGIDKMKTTHINTYIDPLMMPLTYAQFYGLSLLAIRGFEVLTTIQVPDMYIHLSTYAMTAIKVDNIIKKWVNYRKHYKYTPNHPAMFTLSSMKIAIPAFAYDAYLNHRQKDTEKFPTVIQS